MSPCTFWDQTWMCLKTGLSMRCHLLRRRVPPTIETGDRRWFKHRDWIYMKLLPWQSYKEMWKSHGVSLYVHDLHMTFAHRTARLLVQRGSMPGMPGMVNW